VNGHGETPRGGDVLVDAKLNAGATKTMTVVANTAQAATSGFAGGAPKAAPSNTTGSHPVGERIPVKVRDGRAFVQLRDVGPSEVLVLVNRP
jgi:hypothetical protein